METDWLLYLGGKSKLAAFLVLEYLAFCLALSYMSFSGEIDVTDV